VTSASKLLVIAARESTSAADAETLRAIAGEHHRMCEVLDGLFQEAREERESVSRAIGFQRPRVRV
jgi:hypothetical protein